jgi:hypothetical protein
VKETPPALAAFFFLAGFVRGREATVLFDFAAIHLPQGGRILLAK